MEGSPSSNLVGGVNYTDLLVEALQRYPRREAFVFGERRMTYGALADGVSRMQQSLAARGVGTRSTVALLSPNAPEVWMVQAAVYLLGARYSGLHLFGSPDDHGFLCGDADVDTLVVHPECAEAGAAVAARSHSVRTVLTLGPSDLGEDLLALADGQSDAPLRRSEAVDMDVAWMPYTGGTTGRSKGVLLPHRALIQQVQTFSVSTGMPQVPRFLASAPLSHAGVLPIVPTLLRGGTVVVHRSFDPEQWLRTVQNERINYGFAVPTMLYALLDSGLAAKFDLSSLESVIYGASPMSPERIEQAHESIGPVLTQAYGQTECVSFATTLRSDEHDPRGRPDLLKSCGRPVVGLRVDVLSDDDQPVEPGQVGEICVRGRGVMAGYHRLPEETAQAFRSGWLHTGDLATRDEDGYFYIVDRKKDIIITGGYNVYPREVEDAIATDPGVAAVAVIGVPDDRWGERVSAFVVARPGQRLDPAAIADRVLRLKGKHQAPKSVEIVAELPLTPVGKIDKKALRAPYWIGQERMVH